MHPDHETFIAALESRETLTIAFAAAENHAACEVRICAPLDFGPDPQPGPDPQSGPDRYHLWDYDSDSRDDRCRFALLADQIVSIEPTHDTFDPGEFITWPTDWHHHRDWGSYS